MLSVPTPGLIRLSAAETSGPLALDAPPSPGDELTEGGRLNQARSQARRIVANRHFNDAITFCILSGSVILAMDAPGDDDIEKEPWSRPVDVTFTIEAALKILALGFCSYLHDHWHGHPHTHRRETRPETPAVSPVRTLSPEDEPVLKTLIQPSSTTIMSNLFQ